MAASNPTPLSDAELRELEQLLEGHTEWWCETGLPYNTIACGALNDPDTPVFSACYEGYLDDDGKAAYDKAALLAVMAVNALPRLLSEVRGLRESIYGDIQAERARQDAQWGGPQHDDTHTPEHWFSYRRKFEERVMDERVSHDRIRVGGNTTKTHRDSLVKIAALAIAQIASLDRQAALSQSSSGGR